MVVVGAQVISALVRLPHAIFHHAPLALSRCSTHCDNKSQDRATKQKKIVERTSSVSPAQSVGNGNFFAIFGPAFRTATVRPTESARLGAIDAARNFTLDRST